MLAEYKNTILSTIVGIYDKPRTASDSKYGVGHSAIGRLILIPIGPEAVFDRLDHFTTELEDAHVHPEDGDAGFEEAVEPALDEVAITAHVLHTEEAREPLGDVHAQGNNPREDEHDHK